MSTAGQAARAARRAALALGAAGALLGASGCQAGRTRLSGALDEHGAMDRLEEQLRLRPRAEAVAVAIGATTEGVVGVPLGGGSSWSFDHRLSSRPDVAGGVVVGAGGGELFCLRATTGALLWSRPIGGLELIGVGDDGDMTAVSLASASGRSSTLLVVGRDGEVLRQLESEPRLGKPAVVHGVAFVPSREQQLIAYDVLGGRELARLVLDHALTTAFVAQQTLYFGDQALHRFDAQLGLFSTGELPRVSIPETALVPSPRLVLLPRDARALLAARADRQRAHALPTPIGSPLALTGGRFFVTDARAVLAYQAGSRAPSWWQLLGSAPLGAGAYHGGLAVCDEDGLVTLLAEDTGHVEATMSLGRPVLSCLVQGGDLQRAASGASVLPLPDQLLAVLRAPDPDLAPVQQEALAALDRLEPEEALRVLLALASDTGTAAPVRAALPALLTRRPQGVERLLAAVKPSDEPDRTAPVVALGGLVQVLVALGDARAAPLLLGHLDRSRDDAAAVRAAAVGLETLARREERAGLEAFFLRHLGVTDDDRAEAVAAAARALRRLGAPGLRARLDQALASPATSSAVRTRLERLRPP